MRELNERGSDTKGRRVCASDSALCGLRPLAGGQHGRTWGWFRVFSVIYLAGPTMLFRGCGRESCMDAPTWGRVAHTFDSCRALGGCVRSPDTRLDGPRSTLRLQNQAAWFTLDPVVRETSVVATAAFTKRNRPVALIVTPGASADRDHPTLVAIERGLPEIVVRRLTLGTTRVPTAVSKIVEAGTELAAELGAPPTKIAYGGRSFGGRACSVAVAGGLPASALVLLSYPLHPPGMPDNLRTDHFPDIDVPTLFASGRKDPFGKPEEFAEHVGLIPGQTTIEWVDGNHSPKDNDQIVVIVRDYLGLSR
jgi:predicted alpha/beta-hydrolase family hydrolase